MQSKKYGLFVLMAVFVVSIAMMPAYAQSDRITADVPFDFAVGSSHFQAGSYKIQTRGEIGTFVAFIQADGKTAYTLLNPGSDATDHKGQPYLVFNRYGSESFLTKIVFSSDRSYDLPPSSREKEILAHATPEPQVEVPLGGSR